MTKKILKRIPPKILKHIHKRTILDMELAVLTKIARNHANRLKNIRDRIVKMKEDPKNPDHMRSIIQNIFKENNVFMDVCNVKMELWLRDDIEYDDCDNEIYELLNEYTKQGIINATVKKKKVTYFSSDNTHQ
jgi:hypothetical protein